MYIILASKSPRRREILTNAGYNIRVSASDVEETVGETNPEDKVLAIAKKKGLDVYKKFVNDDQAIILSADTIVVVDDEILGKPQDKEDARNMISKLQGRAHNVYTAVFIKSLYYEDSFIEKTEVNVASMTDEEIENYISSNEPYDKAGGYGIQGIFSQYITSINGDYYNVMGLPINKVKEVLKKYDLSHKLQCPNCKNEVKETDQFCLSCGTKLNIISKKKVCTKCHKINKTESKYCEFCGNDLSNSASFVYNDNECPICHHINTQNFDYCEACGTKLKIDTRPDNPIKIKKMSKDSGLATASLVLGIIGLVTSFTCCGIFVLVPLLASIFGIIGITKGNRDKAVAGLVMGSIGLILSIIMLISLIANGNFYIRY